MKYLFSFFLLGLYGIQATAQSYTLEGNEIHFEQELTFRKGSAELNAADIAVLKAVKDFMDEKKIREPSAYRRERTGQRQRPAAQ